MLLRAFADAGVRDVVISPGSRSTPFVLAAAGDERLRIHTIIDERAAGFFALGQGRASGLPSLLICTSGSGPAHYLPAIIEAKQSYTPMLVLSADRGLDSQQSGAQQTIDQMNLFGGQAKGFVELGVADGAPPSLRATRRLVAQAVALALGPAAGAVHLNARALKPLEPVPPRNAREQATSEGIRALAESELMQVTRPRVAPALAPLQALAKRVADEPEGLLALGPGPTGPFDTELESAIVALAELVRYPILTQPTSTVTTSTSPLVLMGAESTLLASARGRAALRPKLIVQVCGAPVVGGYDDMMAMAPPIRLEILSAWPEVDAEGRAHVVHVGDLLITVKTLTDEVQKLKIARASSSWVDLWTRSASLVADACRKAFESLPADDEQAVVCALAKAVSNAPSPPTMIVGNSLPVRELAMAAGIIEARSLRSLHQRGACGIDGMCAGAAGVASISGPTLVLLGDVTLLHDMHGLYVAGQSKVPLVIVVIANGGGRIFDTLPIGRRPDLDEQRHLFTTPIEPDWPALAQFCRATYARVDRAADVAAALDLALARSGATVLELRVAPESAASFIQNLPQRVDAALGAAGVLQPVTPP